LSKVITKEVINDLADDTSNSSIGDIKSLLSRVEIETIINDIRKEANESLLNANRASRAADRLRIKAVKKQYELEKCEKLLNY
jgi:hypothetical protein